MRRRRVAPLGYARRKRLPYSTGRAPTRRRVLSGRATQTPYTGAVIRSRPAGGEAVEAARRGGQLTGGEPSKSKRVVKGKRPLWFDQPNYVSEMALHETNLGAQSDSH